MKKVLFLVAALAMCATTAQAQRYEHHYYHHEGNRNGWVAPLVGGMVAGALIEGMTRPAPVYVPTCWDEVVGYDLYNRPMIRRVCR